MHRRILSLMLAIVLLSPITAVSAADKPRTDILGGMPFGLTMYTGGVIVVNIDESYDSPAKHAGLQKNDLITHADGAAITSNEQLRELIEESKGADIELSVLRGKSPISLSVTPERDERGNYTAGMWVRDSTAGLGTVTYFDPHSHTFGALGHGICDRDTGMLLPLGSGKIVKAEIDSVSKAKKGVAGGLNGSMTDEELGSLTLNCGYGVYGSYTAAPKGEEVSCAAVSEIGTGEAVIYTTVGEGEPQAYTVNIESLNLSDNSGQNMILRVTDKKLKEKTGGIVQGMSGSPIVQDGRLVGAVTHVFVNTPEKGYGISIGNMLNCTDS